MPAFKIASFEIGDLGLIAHAGSYGRPLILSTGMARLSEIEDAIRAGRHAGAQDSACSSAHRSTRRRPTP